MSTQADEAGVGRLSAVIRNKINTGIFLQDDNAVLITIAPYPEVYIQALQRYSSRKSRVEGFRVIECFKDSEGKQCLRIEVLDEDSDR